MGFSVYVAAKSQPSISLVNQSCPTTYIAPVWLAVHCCVSDHFRRGCAGLHQAAAEQADVSEEEELPARLPPRHLPRGGDAGQSQSVAGPVGVPAGDGGEAGGSPVPPAGGRHQVQTHRHWVVAVQPNVNLNPVDHLIMFYSVLGCKCKLTVSGEQRR